SRGATLRPCRSPPASAAFAESVEAERRADLAVDAPSLQILPDGRLASDFGSLPLSERAIEGLGTLVTPGGAGYLASCPPDLHATNVNHWLSGAVDATGTASSSRGISPSVPDRRVAAARSSRSSVPATRRLTSTSSPPSSTAPSR